MALPHDDRDETRPAADPIDLTRMDLQRQLLQAQKLEIIGRLTGGIAHDFNNLLAVITGTADVALANGEVSAALRAELEVIRAAAERAATITGKLLAITRQQPVSPAAIDLNLLITELSAMLTRVIGTDIGITVNTTADLARVTADAGQIEQVLINMVVNARDAMPYGGTVTISTANALVEGRPFGRVAVSDTGIGMDEATRQRIFEPFFTTKDTGKGTGLGLSIARGIIEECGGFIRVDSAPQRGATFEIYLPTTIDTPAPTAYKITG